METPQATKPPVTQQATKLKAFQEITVGKVLAQVTEMQQVGAIDLPADYSTANALKAAWFTLLVTEDRNKRPVIESCTPESICNSLLEMVTQGLNPAKKQCAFVAYGNMLTLSVEYFGKIALAKRYNPTIDKVTANVIYEKDVFKYEINPVTGVRKVIEHSQVLENIDPEKIKGAYATIIFTDGSTEMEPMTMAQVRKAWGQGAANGASPAHKNFPDQMAKKSVINRILKPYINASDDSELLPPTGSEMVPKTANTKAIDIDCEEVKEPVKIVQEAAHPETKPEPKVDGPDF
jgi:recombination protein RecT